MYISSISFSLWCDFVERSFLGNEFKTLIKDEIINGATSNPSIFYQAFKNSSAYKEDIEKLKEKSPKQIYEALAIKDITVAANELLSLHTKEDDGFISIEVDPFLANDVKATVEEGRRLFKQINMPNVMIKIPATDAGYEAMQTLVSDGINVNATLIFSKEQAQKCLDAFKFGSEQFTKTYPNKALPKAVISVFVSRFDRKLDKILKDKNLPTGKVGIMNAMSIYKLISEFGLTNVRCLFASTGVKGDDLDKEYYIEKLLLPNSINTAPLETIYAFIASGKSSPQALPSEQTINGFFKELAEAGIDMQKACDELMSEGMLAFEQAFKEMLDILK